MLGTKVGIANLIAECAVVDAIAAELAEIRGAESTGCVGTDVKVFVGMIDSTQRAT